MSKEIYDFFHLSLHSDLNAWLEDHTTQKKGGVSSTFRVSKTAPTKWRSEMSWDDIKKIQDSCKKALSLWEYVLAKNENDVQTFNPVKKFKFP